MAKREIRSVTDYIAAQPEAAQPVLRRIRAILRKALPRAEEIISYRIPAYRRDGHVVLYFAGWKAHYSLYPASDAVVTALGSQLAPYKVSRGTIRFPLADPVPEKLIVAIAKLRAAETTARATTSSKARKTR